MEPLDDPVIPQKKLKKSLDPDVLADSLPNAPALPLSLPLLALPLDPVPQPGGVTEVTVSVAAVVVAVPPALVNTARY